MLPSVLDWLLLQSFAHYLFLVHYYDCSVSAAIRATLTLLLASSFSRRALSVTSGCITRLLPRCTLPLTTVYMPGRSATCFHLPVHWMMWSGTLAFADADAPAILIECVAKPLSSPYSPRATSLILVLTLPYVRRHFPCHTRNAVPLTGRDTQAKSHSCSEMSNGLSGVDCGSTRTLVNRCHSPPSSFFAKRISMVISRIALRSYK